MTRIYTTLTKHCIKQIQRRNPKKAKEKSAIIFGLHVFSEFILKGEYKGRQVRMSYQKDGKYRITDGVHQFIYTKPHKIEYILITYVKREKILGKELRPTERFIGEGFKGSGS